MSDFNLSGRIAVVTGGSSGIGLSTATLLLQQGASVAICGRDTSRLTAALATLTPYKQTHAQLFAASCDVLSPESVHHFAAQCATTLGQASILINNAGQGRVSTFANTSDADWSDELALKFFSVIHPTRAFLPQLRQHAPSDASIVCVNSLLAAQPEPHMVVTSAARAGVRNLVRSMATEFAPMGVRVNGILLGLVESAQWHRRFDGRTDTRQDWPTWSRQLATQKSIPLNRLGRAQEAAQAIFFLASPLSSYTTGSHLDVSGGLSHHA